jgi:hypothetical protein
MGYIIIDLPTTSVHGEATLGLNFDRSFVDGYVGEDETDVFLSDESIFIKIVTNIIRTRYVPYTSNASLIFVSTFE